MIISLSFLNNRAPHWSVRIQFLALILDSWDTENVVVSVDSAQQQKTFLFNNFVQNICGSSFADSYTIMDFNTTHTASTMAVKISNTLDQAPDDESLGIRDIFILVDFVRIISILIRYLCFCDLTSAFSLLF